MIEFIKLHMTRERPIEYDIEMRTPKIVYEIVQKLIGQSDSEMGIALLLDSKAKINAVHEFSHGTLNSTYMHPREVFKAAVLANCNSIIIAHNHPSGDLSPSDQDIEATKKLVKAGKILGITVIDHLIVSDKDYFSLKANKKIKF